MAAESSILKFSLKTNIVKSIFFEIISNVSRYYYTFGKSSQWPTVTGINQNNQQFLISDEDNPPAVSDSYIYELETRREISYAKYIDANDVAVVVSRINWTVGRVYDQYDQYSEDYISFNGAPSMDVARFYVLTDDFNVYKCLFNNRNALSIVKPTTTTPEPFKLEDGYIWKFMYSIPLSLRNKFLTSAYMPVVTALTNQFYSNGSINSYSIEKKGKGYIKNAWKIKKFIISNPGIGYTQTGGAAITITFPQSVEGGTRATAVVTQLNSTGGITEIQITNQGAGYTYQPIPTISGAGSGFEYVLEYEKDLSAFTELKLIGDGFNQFNPYSLKKVNILNRGTFTSANVPSGFLFTFPAVQASYGRIPVVNVTFRLKAGQTTLYEVDEVLVEDTGYGYSQKLVFGENVTAQPLTTFGFNCNLDENSQKNDAELIPLINSSGEIEAIQISPNAPGVGYTFGVVKVIGKKTILMIPEDPNSTNLVDLSTDPNAFGYTPGFEEASILINFSIGDIETKQSNVELLAVDGEIPVIVVDVKGNGYPPDTQIVIAGDGKDCEAEAVIVNGQIDRIEVTNPGRGYTYANVTAIGGGINSSLRAIIAPRGGHGKDAISELYAKTLMLVTRLTLEKNQGIEITNDFRQICIIKNPTNYGTNNFFTKAIGSAALKLELDVTPTNTISYNQFQLDDQLFIGTNKLILLEKIKSNDKYYLLVLPIDNVIPATGSTIFKISGNSSYSMGISIVTPPEFNKYSGEMLYTDNRVKFASTAEQTIATSTLITF
jgi:hypothetical protein